LGSGLHHKTQYDRIHSVKGLTSGERMSSIAFRQNNARCRIAPAVGIAGLIAVLGVLHTPAGSAATRAEAAR
jgi:hypothetical protein